MTRKRNRKGKRRKSLLDTTAYSVERPAKSGNSTILEACGGDKDKLYSLLFSLGRADGLQTTSNGEIQKFRMTNRKYQLLFGEPI
ncbi:MAG: hypothetical protein KAS32_21715 [Candidatus Peribacteraceae bacterium]|nr:hypothetical protein [Candidatus Peribacteraceae bacterium]